VPFESRDDTAPHLAGQILPKKQFWGVNSRIQAEVAKYYNVHISETAASIPNKLCTVTKTTKCPLWVVQTCASQIQDGGRPPSWNNRKIAIFQHWCDRSPRNLAWWRILTLLILQTLKIRNFKSPRWRRPPSWKIEKSPSLCNGLTDHREFFHGDAYWHVDAYLLYRQLKIRPFKNPRWRRTVVLTIENIDMSVKVWPIDTI